MARKQSSSTRDPIKQVADAALQSETECTNKIMNCMANTSIILMSTMMGAFTQVMANATAAMASGLVEALGGKEDEEKVNEEFKEKLPEIDEKTKAVISDIRKDIYAQMGQKRKEMELLLSDQVFEIGPKIIEKYDSKLPKLTQELDDSSLSQYSRLLVNGDTRFVKMFKKLTKWINSLPQLPEKKSPENGNNATLTTKSKGTKHESRQRNRKIA